MTDEEKLQYEWGRCQRKEITRDEFEDWFVPWFWNRPPGPLQSMIGEIELTLAEEDKHIVSMQIDLAAKSVALVMRNGDTVRYTIGEEFLKEFDHIARTYVALPDT